MAKVILFDLDGTLLPMDTDKFVETYIKELAGRVSHIVHPDTFVEALWGGTKSMMTNIDPEKTNEQVFEENFLKMADLDKDKIWPVLDDFYETVFPTFSYLCQPTPLGRKVVEEAIKQGYRVAVATNPVFPKSAIYHRLSWAGLNNIPFELVTVYEESHFTKPHPQYYRHISEKLGVQPEECVMAGNDKQEDMAAEKAGMKTFLVKGCVIDRGTTDYRVDDEGTLQDLYTKISEQQGLFRSSSAD
ncbi:HAD family hydrolase [Salipaludibacillus aurantiacus]|uniref:Haloacid dehalogenase superfamily, subfamily IA, variant 1 with third motif having Dx(3-4)D or Dx(3-4)E n=1 Tax=Salipaludibacillus aurantiacus TaxID=1601833 RepID=A0A1H9NXX7_9BACI|nr:HAD family hydrolase [Salipaludibacillus aurantiacus]SER40792.1 haloacid dehalogenase superfamily, subfamily IA, variant 1 with third motif having Dx(3-4)D or Dx(3-4)E [Salipaludibacillus aurantiacus]